jgi:hypothetical protein
LLPELPSNSCPHSCCSHIYPSSHLNTARQDEVHNHQHDCSQHLGVSIGPQLPQPFLTMPEPAHSPSQPMARGLPAVSSASSVMARIESAEVTRWPRSTTRRAASSTRARGDAF